jgi:hypothetical protein
MRLLLAVLLLILPVTARAEEDAEHRADRLRTVELNRRAAAAVARRDRGNADVRSSNGEAMRRYQRQLEQWRRQVAACRAGDYSACD